MRCGAGVPFVQVTKQWSRHSKGRRLFYFRMRIFCDHLVLDSQPQRTPEGYLRALPRIARTGLQDYLAGELGLSDREPYDVIRVYRPEEEVFAADALASLAHIPVTINHPTVQVDASNWREVSFGQTGAEVIRDKEFVRVPMVVMDARAIAMVIAGKSQLSVGYTAELDFTPGVTKDGDKYDAVQRKIRGNHLAIVDRARGGSMLKVFDSQPLPNKHEDRKMKKHIIIDGIQLELEDAAHLIVQRYLDGLTSKTATLEAANAALTTQVTTLSATVQAKDAEIVTLKQQVADSALTPAKLDAAVAARAVVVDSARKVMPAVVVDGKTEAEIRRQVVDARLGDASKGWSDDQITASFNTLTSSGPTVQHDSFRTALQSNTNQNVSTPDAAYTKMCDDIGNAWRGQAK